MKGYCSGLVDTAGHERGGRNSGVFFIYKSYHHFLRELISCAAGIF